MLFSDGLRTTMGICVVIGGGIMSASISCFVSDCGQRLLAFADTEAATAAVRPAGVVSIKEGSENIRCQ